MDIQVPEETTPRPVFPKLSDQLLMLVIVSAHQRHVELDG